MDLKKLIVINTAAFVGPFGANAVLPLFNILATELITDYGLITLSITALMIPFAIIQLFSGTLSDLFNRQQVCFIGLLTYGLGAFLVSISKSFEFLIFARVIQGLGYGIIYPVVIALLGDLSNQEQRGRLMGLLGASTTAGVAFGPLFAGFLVAYGWPIIFYITAGMSILIGLAFWLCFRDFPSHSKEKRRLRDFFSQIQTTMTWNIFLFAIIGFVIFLSYIGLNVSIVDRYSMLFPSLTPEAISYETGILLAAGGISGIIISPIAGLSADKLSRKKTAYIGGIILAVALAMFSFGDSFISFFILFYGFGTGAAVIWAAFNTITVELDSESRGTVSSISNGFRFFGYSLASPFYILFGLPNLYIACTILAIITLGLLLVLRVPQTGQ